MFLTKNSLYKHMMNANFIGKYRVLKAIGSRQAFNKNKQIRITERNTYLLTNQYLGRDDDLLLYAMDRKHAKLIRMYFNR